MNVFEPAKPKRPRAKGDSPQLSEKSDSQAPALEAGASVFGVALDAGTLARCAKLSVWTVVEAAHFTAGCKPVFDPLGIPSFSHQSGWLDEPILYRQTLFERYLLSREGGTYIAPLDALQLLESKGEWVDPEMRDAVLHIHASKKRKKTAVLKPRLGDFLPDDDEDDERPVALKRKLSTARKIMFAISVAQLGHKPGKHFNSTPKVIAAIIKDQKLNCDEDTIRRHLKAAQEDHWIDPNL